MSTVTPENLENIKKEIISFLDKKDGFSSLETIQKNLQVANIVTSNELTKILKSMVNENQLFYKENNSTYFFQSYESLYRKAKKTAEKGGEKWEEAVELFKKLGNYSDSKILATEYKNKIFSNLFIQYEKEFLVAKKTEDYEKLGQLFSALKKFPGAKEKANECFEIARKIKQEEFERAQELKNSIVEILNEQNTPLSKAEIRTKLNQENLVTKAETDLIVDTMEKEKIIISSVSLKKITSKSPKETTKYFSCQLAAIYIKERINSINTLNSLQTFHTEFKRIYDFFEINKCLNLYEELDSELAFAIGARKLSKTESYKNIDVIQKEITTFLTAEKLTEFLALCDQKRELFYQKHIRELEETSRTSIGALEEMKIKFADFNGYKNTNEIVDELESKILTLKRQQEKEARRKSRIKRGIVLTILLIPIMIPIAINSINSYKKQTTMIKALECWANGDLQAYQWELLYWEECNYKAVEKKAIELVQKLKNEPEKLVDFLMKLEQNNFEKSSIQNEISSFNLTFDEKIRLTHEAEFSTWVNDITSFYRLPTISYNDVEGYVNENGKQKLHLKRGTGGFYDGKKDSSWRHTVGISGSPLYDAQTITHLGDFKCEENYGVDLNSNYQEEYYSYTTCYFKDNMVLFDDPNDYTLYYSGKYLFALGVDAFGENEIYVLNIETGENSHFENVQ